MAKTSKRALTLNEIKKWCLFAKKGTQFHHIVPWKKSNITLEVYYQRTKTLSCCSPHRSLVAFGDRNLPTSGL